MQPESDHLRVLVRATRSGTARDGRTYSFRYRAVDSANATYATATTIVPHDQRK